MNEIIKRNLDLIKNLTIFGLVIVAFLLYFQIQQMQEKVDAKERYVQYVNAEICPELEAAKDRGHWDARVKWERVCR
jgi:hypothetical protein